MGSKREGRRERGRKKGGKEERGRRERREERGEKGKEKTSTFQSEYTNVFTYQIQSNWQLP